MKVRDAQLSAAGAEGKTYIEDVFSTYLYTGNGSTQTINNGIDLAGKGGMVWTKIRDNTDSHSVFDTNRGALQVLQTNTSNQAQTQPNSLTSFNSNGFDLGSFIVGNWNTYKYASWTFRKAPKFFDVVTYTGNATAGRTISHSLGQAPGMILVKRTDSTGNWFVYHRSTGAASYLVLNQTYAVDNNDYYWNNTSPTASSFTLSADGGVNASGATYVAYLFAHDTTTDGMIQCGSFTPGSSDVSVDLGWEPQYVLVKATDTSSNWLMADSMRGMTADATGARFNANLESAETQNSYIGTYASGFKFRGGYFSDGTSCIYMAIRRPMKVPTDGTKVFKPVVGSDSNVSTGFPVDVFMINTRGSQTNNTAVGTRLLGWSPRLVTSNTNAESTNSFVGDCFQSNVSYNPGFYGSGSLANYAFRRAPGFFDVVCYTGTGVSYKVINHNLGASPELVIIKQRSGIGGNWMVAAASQSLSKSGELHDPKAFYNYGTLSALSSTTFTTGVDASVTNLTSQTYVAYLFASCPGVSKVGSYTGNGSSQTINCGFSAGARFVLIKRTDSTGDWYVFDTARGINAGADPMLLLNATNAEVSTSDIIDPYPQGFSLPAADSTNASGGTYIYLAIA